MKEHFVIDPLISKRQQLLLATQLCRMVLKVRVVTFPPLFRNELSFVAPHTLGVTPFPAIPSASLPSVQPRFAHFPSLASVFWIDCKAGEAGKPKIKRRTGGALYAGCIVLVTREQTHPSLFSLCVTVYPHCWITALLQTTTDTNAQVNNVIIAGNDDQDF